LSDHIDNLSPNSYLLNDKNVAEDAVPSRFNVLDDTGTQEDERLVLSPLNIDCIALNGTLEAEPDT
jgi:hypothetical protein